MRKIALVFPGQGAQYIGMGKELYEKYIVCKEIFEKADEALDFDLMELCFNGPESELNKTEKTQPAIFVVSMAVLKLIEENNIKIDATAGFSLGEYSALVCAGVLDFVDVVKLVRKRGQYMQEAVPENKGLMAAIVGLEAEQVNEVCEEIKNIGYVTCANFNCPGQVVIAGEKKAVEAACQKAKEKGAKMAMALPVSIPSHTKMLEPAAKRLEAEIEKITFKNNNIPVISNVTADYFKNTDEVKELMIKQVVSPVLWENTIRKMIADGIDTFIEVGPGKVLSGFLKRIDKNCTILNVEDCTSLEKTSKILKEETC